MIAFVGIIISSGCATMNNNAPVNQEQVAERFFSKLQHNDRQGAYQMLSWQLTQNISYDQFEGLQQTIKDEWGSLTEAQSILLPFHQRAGEGSFLSPSLPEDKIKRYVYELTCDNAVINCDITVAPQGTEYKVFWISFWGSNIYLKPSIQQKMEELFAHPAGNS